VEEKRGVNKNKIYYGFAVTAVLISKSMFTKFARNSNGSSTLACFKNLNLINNMVIILSKLRIEQLTDSNISSTVQFDCGDQDLNEFLKDDPF